MPRRADDCAGSDNTSTPLAISPLTIVAVTEETTVTPSPEIDPALRTLVDQAVADLATRLKIDASSIVTVSAQAMAWPDGSLGLPSAGDVVHPGDGRWCIDPTERRRHELQLSLRCLRSAVPVPKDLSFDGTAWR